MLTSSIQPEDIHPLTDFLRNSKSHIQRLKKRGRPAILTLNGKASVVMIDAAAYQAMMAENEAARDIEEGIKSIEQQKGVPAEVAFAQLRAKHGFKK